MVKYEYSGKKNPNQISDIKVWVRETHIDRTLIAYHLPHIEKRSPDGSQWEYGGSGPSDFALSILSHFCKNRSLSQEIADKYYQDFKFAFVAKFDDEFKISCREIAEWLVDKDPQLEEILFKGRTKKNNEQIQNN